MVLFNPAGISVEHSDRDASTERQEFPPTPGTFFRTSILQWSFAGKSFWRLPDMATVMDIAKSIAMVGWRDVPWIQGLARAGLQNLNPIVAGEPYCSIHVILFGKDLTKFKTHPNLFLH